MDKLNSPTPPLKKLPQYRLYRCQWQIGDTYAYRLESDEAREQGLWGRYLIMQKVDEATWYPGHIIPIVRIKMTEDTQLPQDEAQINSIPYFIMHSYIRFGQANYLAELISTSKRIIPKKLIFLGNYTHILPIRETIQEKREIWAMSWKDFDKMMVY